jgi:hypothetical protein
MKTMLRLLILLVLSALPAGAQTLTQQTATRLDACNAVATAVGAAGTAQTATATALGGNYIYICAIALEVCTNGTGSVQNNVVFTSTNIIGSPSWSYSIAATANICQRIFEEFPTPLRAAVPGSNVTVVSPTLATNNNYGIRIYYYLAR